MGKSAPKQDMGLQASDLEDLFGYNLKRAYMIVAEDFRSAFANKGVSARVFSALSLVVSFPNITQSALARMMQIERSGLVAIVDELEQRGYLNRAAVPGDRRVQALMPTGQGKAAYAEMLDIVRRHENALFEDMSEGEKQTLLTLLKKIRRKEPQ